ncbi:MAG: chemotaxis protein [Zoogloeaceae bacterium]|nr:chemotaxis protein [Zoogloeaceae bacterium]
MTTRPRPGASSTAAHDLLRIVRINEEIKQVVKVSFRINVMALNAIFLAKRAGTSALGFGVLSNELRVFSRDLRDSMTSLTAQVHAVVDGLSVVLQASRQDHFLVKTGALVNGKYGLTEVLVQHAGKRAALDARIARLRKNLQSSVDDAVQLVELGGVLAKSAKIEAAYGADFAPALSQVSGEFDRVVEEIRVSLDKLKRSGFFKGKA